MNPVNHWRSDIFWFITSGLDNGTILSYISFNSAKRPKFIDALIATILCKPSIVKCFLFKTRLNACIKVDNQFVFFLPEVDISWSDL